VQHGLGAALVRVARDLGAEHVVLEEGHRTGVLHGAGVELRDEQLVILAEGVRDAEVVVVERESLFGFGEQPLRVHVFGQRLAAEDSQWDVAVVVGVHVVPAGVRSGDERRQVGAHPGCRLEGVAFGARIELFDLDGGTVGNHLPVPGCDDGDVEEGLQIGLVETREHPLGVRGFEL
jgi:hypothetical protein